MSGKDPLITIDNLEFQPQQSTYTAVRGVLDPPEPAPSMLKTCPPLFWVSMIWMASLVHSIEPIRFVETICIK